MVRKMIIEKLNVVSNIKKHNKSKKIQKAVKRGVKEYEETFKRLAQV